MVEHSLSSLSASYQKTAANILHVFKISIYFYFFSCFRVVNRTFATTKGQKYQKSTV